MEDCVKLPNRTAPNRDFVSCSIRTIGITKAISRRWGGEAGGQVAKRKAERRKSGVGRERIQQWGLYLLL